MKPLDEPHGLCSVDPITLTGLALAGLAGAGATAAISGGGATAAAPTPVAPAPTAAAPPASSPMGQAKPPAPAQQSFIGAAATPNTQSGQKTLLGQ